jgi:hypothetical protein
MDNATELAIDLLWFLNKQTWSFYDGKKWGNTMPAGFLETLEILDINLPISISYIMDDKNKETDQVKNWQKEVRDLMKKMGFYSGTGNFKEPSQTYYKKKIKENSLSAKEPGGNVAYVFVCTNNGMTQAKLKDKTNDIFTIGTFVYAEEARARSKKINGGVLVEMLEGSTVDEFWNALKGKTKNRAIKTIQFFDHGGKDSQLIAGMDGGEINSTCDIPQDIGTRFSSGAEITLYGCNTMKDNTATSKGQSKLANHLGARLLIRGGKVIGFATEVLLTIDKEKNEVKFIEPKSSDRREFVFLPSRGSNVTEEIIQFMRKYKDNIKVKYASIPNEKGEKEVVDNLRNMQEYPSDYPNESYYA